MIRAIVFFLVVIAVAVIVGWVGVRPGEVSVVWLGQQIDAPVRVLLLAAALLIVLAILLWSLWRLVTRSPRQFARARADSRRRKAYRALTQGMVAVAAGDAGEARRQAKLAGTLLNDPPLTLLLAAQAAQLGGDERAAEKYFRAMLDRPETAFLGLRGLLMQSLKAGNNAESLQLARQAATERPNTAWAVSTLLDLELRSGEWAHAMLTLKRAERLKAIEPPAAKRARAVLLAEQARSSADLDSAIGRLRDAIKLQPDLLPARVLLATSLARAGRGRDATRVVEQGWAASPHAELAAAYAQIEPAEDALARVRRFERLAGLNPTHLESRLALGGAYLAAGLWGKARTELDQALSLAGASDDNGAGVPRRLAKLMARLEEGEGGGDVAIRRWLVAAAEAPADPAWTCDKCGTVAAAWSARCDHCASFDSLLWRAPSGTGGTQPSLAALDGPLPALAAPAPAGAVSTAGPDRPPDAATAPSDAAPVDAARRVN